MLVRTFPAPLRNPQRYRTAGADSTDPAIRSPLHCAGFTKGGKKQFNDKPIQSPHRRSLEPTEPVTTGPIPLLRQAIGKAGRRAHDDRGGGGFRIPKLRGGRFPTSLPRLPRRQGHNRRGSWPQRAITEPDDISRQALGLTTSLLAANPCPRQPPADRKASPRSKTFLAERHSAVEALAGPHTNVDESLDSPRHAREYRPCAFNISRRGCPVRCHYSPTCRIIPTSVAQNVFAGQHRDVFEFPFAVARAPQ